MMRGTLLTIFNSALAAVAALLLATTLAPSVRAQVTQRQTHDGRTATPSSTTTPTAQTQTPDTQTPRAQESGAEPDLSITAHVTADSLRFERVPDPKVEFTGKPRRDTVWQSERENLPQQVQPGVTYRNIGITLRITSVFADINRIVAEALGEVPTSDDNNQQQAAPPAQTPSPAKPVTRANARGRAERRGRGR
jgi:hypothetical protein